MKRERQIERIRQSMIDLCHSGLNSQTIRLELLQHLQTVVPFDYVYFSTTDPATQLHTGSVMLEPPPSWLMPVFLENEYQQEDVLHFRSMHRQRQTVGILSEATQHDPQRSPRFRAMLAPLQMTDELRAVFAINAACWGTLCLHRGGSGYTTDEAAFLSQIAPHIADGLRKALLLESASLTTPDGPGVLLLADDLSILAATAAADYWLGEIATDGQPLPPPVRSVVAALRGIEQGTMPATLTPKVRLRTTSGQWLILYASRLRSANGGGQISVIIEAAQPAEFSPLMMLAYNLTKREGEITQCVLLGWSTAEIAAKLFITPNTVQDHLKAIFEKVSVNSRGELAGRIAAQYSGSSR